MSKEQPAARQKPPDTPSPPQQNWGGVPPARAFDNVRRFPPPVWQQEQARQEQLQAQRKAQPPRGKKAGRKKKKAQPPPRQEAGKSSRKTKKPTRKRQVNPARRRRQRRLAAVLAIVVLVGLGAWFSVTVLFKINKYDIQGDVPIYSEEQILDAFGHVLGDNLYGFSISAAEERLMTKLPYIEKASIRRRPPSTVLFRLTMAQDAYYLPWEGAFAVTNASGKVLRTTGEEPLELIRIDGLSCLVVEPGYPIQLDESAAKAAIKAQEEEAAAASASAAAVSAEPSSSEVSVSQSESLPDSSQDDAENSVAEGESVEGEASTPPPQAPESEVQADPSHAAESFEVMWTLLEALEVLGLENIRWLDVRDPLELSFNWQDRVTVQLGPKSGMEEKMKALVVLLTDPEQGLEEGDRGTIDMTLYLVTGECVFTPE